jgi:hypothetical protein
MRYHPRVFARSFGEKEQLLWGRAYRPLTCTDAVSAAIPALPRLTYWAGRLASHAQQLEQWQA